MEQINNQKENTAKQGNCAHQKINTKMLNEFFEFSKCVPDKILNEKFLISTNDLLNFLITGEIPKDKAACIVFDNNQKKGILQGYFEGTLTRDNEIYLFKQVFYNLVNNLKISKEDKQKIFYLLEDYIYCFISELSKSKYLGLAFGGDYGK